MTAQRYFGEMISQLRDKLHMPFFTAAKELILCHGDVCRVILQALDGSIHDAVFGQQLPPPPRPAAQPEDGSKSPVNTVCAVCSDAGDEVNCIICLPCGDNLCEDCFASRFMSELGAHPELETPHAQTVGAQDGDTPKSKPDYFACPKCTQEFPSSFWESFPQLFAHAQQSSFCSPQLTLSDVHARIIASVLRKLRCDPLAAVARSPEISQASCRYAIAFGLNHEVSCFGSSFETIIHARTVAVESSIQQFGISVAESEKWAKVQQDVKTFDNKSKKLNQAGNHMALHGSRYYCGKAFNPLSILQEELGKKKGLSDESKPICGPVGGQCQDCLVAATELAQEIQTEFVKDSERPLDREQDIRMCPRCFGGYFTNLWCGDLAAHHGQAKEFQVKNVCPGNVNPML